MLVIPYLMFFMYWSWMLRTLSSGLARPSIALSLGEGGIFYYASKSCFSFTFSTQLGFCDEIIVLSASSSSASKPIKDSSSSGSLRLSLSLSYSCAWVYWAIPIINFLFLLRLFLSGLSGLPPLLLTVLNLENLPYLLIANTIEFSIIFESEFISF